MKYFLISIEFNDYRGTNHYTFTYCTKEIFVNKKEIKETITNDNDFFIHFIKELTEEEYNCFTK